MNQKTGRKSPNFLLLHVPFLGLHARRLLSRVKSWYKFVSLDYNKNYIIQQIASLFCLSEFSSNPAVGFKAPVPSRTPLAPSKLAIFQKARACSLTTGISPHWMSSLVFSSNIVKDAAHYHKSGRPPTFSAHHLSETIIFSCRKRCRRPGRQKYYRRPGSWPGLRRQTVSRKKSETRSQTGSLTSSF